MIRVFIADDHELVRVGIRHSLETAGGITVVGEADNGRGVLASPALSQTDVLILDLSLPVVAGSEVLHRLRQSHPAIAVVVHSMHPQSQFRPQMLRAGAAAYVSKEASATELIATVRAAASGTLAQAAQAADAPPAAVERPRLTRREEQVFMLIVMGRQVAEIAAELDVHSCTVSNHLASIRRKLEVQTVAEMVRYAYDAGMVAPAPPLESDDSERQV